MQSSGPTPVAATGPATPRPADAASADQPLTLGSRHAGVVVGSVAGSGGQGAALQVQLPTGPVLLEGAPALPPGTRIALQITSTQPLQAVLHGASAAPAVSAARAPVPDVLLSLTLSDTKAGTAASARAASGLPSAPAAAGTASLLTTLPWSDGAAGGGVRMLAAGTLLPVRLSPAPTTDAVPASAGAAPLSPGAGVTGAIAALLPDGRAVVALDRGGSLLLPAGSGLARGQTVTVLVDGMPQAPQTAMPVALSLEGAMRGSPWPTLNTLWRLSRSDGGLPTPGTTQLGSTAGAAPAAVPSAATAATGEAGSTGASLRATLPQLTGQLGESVRHYLATLSTGDVRGWLGPRVTGALSRSRPGLLERLEQDFATLARAADGAGDAAWSAVSVPLLLGDAIEQARFFFRQPENGSGETGDGGEGGDGGDRRFVVDLVLPELGRVQLDAIVRGGPEAKRAVERGGRRLDLVLRSERPLPAADRDGLRTLAHTAASSHGFVGALAFQAGPGAFVGPVTGGEGSAGIVV